MGMIQCGSFTTDASGNATVNLGWEPQYTLIKSTADDVWRVEDSMRGMNLTGYNLLYPNTSGAESVGTGDLYHNMPTATGFITKGRVASQTYIYMAIRRPMKTPLSSDEVFNAIARTGTGAVATVTGVGFAPDLAIGKCRNASCEPIFADRIRGGGISLFSNGTGAELSTANEYKEFNQDGVSLGISNTYGATNQSTFTYINHFFKRATGFFDVVAYTGDGIAGRTVNHNLGVVPEMMWIKQRDGTLSWAVYCLELGADKRLFLDYDFMVGNSEYFNSTTPTDALFYLNDSGYVNGSSSKYIAYLFATLAGISKVGSYTGNGTSQTIDCGFSTGAKFILIKRTDSTGDWYIWDSVRGIVAGNDPHLSLNTGYAEVTTDDSIDPDTSGFIVNQNATTNINVTSAEYIYYAIAEPI